MAPAFTAAARPRSGPGRPGRPATSRRALINAILYVLWTGCPWRALPDCYLHWRTVHHHFARWAADGTLARLHDALRGRVRAAAGRTVAPTAAVIDSQSVRARDWVSRASKGYDAAKKIHGRKRHLAVDTCGLLLEILVTLPAPKTATVAGGCGGAFVMTCRPSGRSGLMPAMPASWSPGPTGPHPGRADRPQTPGRAPLRGPASPLGRGAHLLLARQVPPAEHRLRAQAGTPPGVVQWAMVRLMVKRLARQAPPLTTRALSLAA
jgi:transposase